MCSSMALPVSLNEKKLFRIDVGTWRGGQQIISGYRYYLVFRIALGMALIFLFSFSLYIYIYGWICMYIFFGYTAQNFLNEAELADCHEWPLILNRPPTPNLQKALLRNPFIDSTSQWPYSFGIKLMLLFLNTKHHPEPEDVNNL